ncbi:diguanylate cyclase (GGDEF)-like protein/PAS domain S-box-containing protein [Halomonas fontilapidosi]|uniref:cyclic-guanylate-specific phosphodiesterase n=1 Tax=Halomonas fontilapidosi TaxID=616675 RepID=A0A7W5DH51_9GAMM|nr:EAL domain-containing protein [Halomonas fontilapidosi]MBB3182832.1 diguanylate cyclase (GGDEF)-like protein/PAS domain S-box-containing protein [Halomonas fontilapidosi]
MPFKTRDIALDSWLLMVSAAFVLMGLAGVVQGLLNSLQTLLVPDAALAAILSGVGLLAVVQHWQQARFVAGGALLALMLYTLGHNAEAGGSQVGVSWLSAEPRLSSWLATILVVVAGCLLSGVEGRVQRGVWLTVGSLLLGIGSVLLALLHDFSAQGHVLSGMTSSPLVVAMFMLLFGAAMLAAGVSGAQRKIKLGRAAVMAGLAGVLVSSLAWALLSWQQQQRVHLHAENLLDNIRLNAEQVMASHLSLMQRMAERLDASADGLEPAVLGRDVANHLRDTPSLEVIGLLDDRQTWRWREARSDELQRWLVQWTNTERVSDWLSMPFPQPRITLPDDNAPALAIMAISVPRRDQQLVAVLDMATLLKHELRVQLSGFQVNLSRDDAVLTSLVAPGMKPHDVMPAATLASRHIGLPGGPMLSPSVQARGATSWLQAGVVPSAVALGGLVLSYLLVFSLGMARLALGHSRQLIAAREQLEQHQAIQAMIAEDRPLDEILEAICLMLESQLNGGICSIMLADDDGHVLRLVAGNSLPTGYRDAVRSIPVGAGIGACGSSAHDRKVVVCEDLAHDPRWKGFRTVATREGLRACWSYPVIASDGRLLGTFATYYRQPASPRDDELDIFRQAVDLVGLAVEREQDRRSLWESEQRYRSLFAYNPDAVFSLDLKGHFVAANAHCAALTGYSVEQMLGAHYAEFLQPDDLAHVQQMFETAAAGDPIRYELQIPNRDGKMRWLDVTNLPVVVDQRIKGVYGIAKDVTRRREYETRLRILERGVEASVNGVVIADAAEPDLPIIYANDAFQRMTGYTREEVIGRNCRFLQGSETDRAVVQQIRQQLAHQREVHVTLCNYRKDGTPFWNDLFIAPVRDEEGRVSHYVGIQHDISEHKAYEARLAYHASHDALTGLANRALLEDRLAHDFELARRQGQLLAVLFVDLDEFKPINDSLGHAIGDQLLRGVAKRLSAAMRAGDTLARLGGDEFVILLPDLHNEEQALHVVERLLTIIARPYRVGEHELSLSCSIGIAVSNTEVAQPLELIQQADMAMYRAKQEGRNGYQWFTPEITHRLGDRVALRNELQEAIDTQAFELHYQPLIDRQGRVASVEALLRWPHPRRGYVSPAQFIPLAEETGQIISISEWVLNRACQDLRMLDQAGQDTLDVAVNLSPLQFHRSSFLGNLRQTLAVTGLPAPQLTLELTEGVLMNDTESAIDTLHALRGMGVGVAIDDFGTGFSSLSYLKNLPIDTVKIDRSFVSEVTHSVEDAAIIQGIISMAHHLGLQVVAEGIEHQAQHQLLLTHGCDLFQGFHFARPMPLETLIEFLLERQPVHSGD